MGVGTTGTDVKNNARPQRPNPGTEVGQDRPNTRPSQPASDGKGYRDWALDLTGAGDPARPGSKPSGPAGIPQGQATPGTPSGSTPRPNPGQVRPGSAGAAVQPGAIAGAATGHGPSTVAPGPVHKAPVPVIPAPGSGQRPPVTVVAPGQSTQAPTAGPRAGQLTPTSAPGQVLPVAPGSVSSGATQKPPGGKTWAEVAGSGSKPATPSPAPRPAQPEPARPGPGAIAAGAATAAGSPTKIYSTNPTYSKGNRVTDEDLEKLCEALFTRDTNNAWRHITINLQKKTSSGSPVDEAPQPLLTVNPAALQIPTIDKVLKLYDNYQLDTRTNEYISPAQRNEESQLVDTFLSTNVMSAAMRFLADKSFVRKDYYEYKDVLRRLWFTLYSRGEGKIGSAGFEHVFLTELKLGTEVSGLHNWIYFNAEEVKRRADYLGYMKKLDLGNKAAILKLHAKFNGYDKPVTSMFIGTSPELEMAIYTVCFFARPDQTCPVSLGGTKFNIMTHKFRYRGKDLIGSAYPEI